MITAYARIVLAVDYTDVPSRDRTIDIFEQTTITGEGATWAEAQAACSVPEDAQVLAWSRWPI